MSMTYDMTIIGAGPGGYSTALRAAELGMRVALVERDATLGGTCLNRGCIPSKALITATHSIDTVRHAAALGIDAHVDGIDYGRLRDYRMRMVDTMTKGLSGLLSHRGVTVFRADATLLADLQDDLRMVSLSPAPGQDSILRFENAENPENLGAELTLNSRHVVLATGGRPRPLPVAPFHGALIDSTQALELDEFPTSAIVIGAGAVAVEFASMWNAAGVEVTLIIRKDRVLSSWDRRVGVTLTRELKRQGVTVIDRASVTGVETGDNLGATVRYSRAAANGGPGAEESVSAEIALAAIGRDPNTDMDWLTQAEVTLDGHGLVETDVLGRTSAEHVWAVGDITPGNALAHRAFMQGIAVAEAIAGLDPQPVDDATVPRIVFSYPEAASVGLTLAEARGLDGLTDVKESVYPMLGNARILMSGVAGSMSLVTGVRGDDKDGAANVPVVLGVHIVSPVASDLIAEAEQLVGNHVPLSEAARLVHPHPTFSETLGEALLKADGRPLHTR